MLQVGDSHIIKNLMEAETDSSGDEKGINIQKPRGEDKGKKGHIKGLKKLITITFTTRSSVGWGWGQSGTKLHTKGREEGNREIYCCKRPEQ